MSELGQRLLSEIGGDGVFLREIERRGYVIVPKEPTQEMLRAGANELDGDTAQDLVDGFRSRQNVAEAVFRAMIEAALK